MKNLPETDKKIIFFAVIGLAALICGFVFVQLTARDFKEIGKATSAISLPQIQLPEVLLPKPAEQLAPNPAAGWKTYVNVDLGFEIKYPPAFSVKPYSRLVGVDFAPGIGLYVPNVTLSAKEWVYKKFGVKVEESQPLQFVVGTGNAIMWHTVFGGGAKALVDVYSANESDADIYANMLKTFTFTQ